MKRQRNRYNKVFSSISDEQLAIIIAGDYKKSPGEFSVVSSCSMTDSKEFLRNTSARAIVPLLNWM